MPNLRDSTIRGCEIRQIQPGYGRKKARSHLRGCEIGMLDISETLSKVR